MIGSAAVFQMSGLGDQLMAWPTLRALDHLLPGRLHLLLGRGLHDLYRDVAVPRDARRIRWRDQDRRELEIPADLGPADLFVSLACWSAPSLLELGRAVAPRTLGFFPGFSERAPYQPDRNMFDVLFAIPQHLEPWLRIEDFAEPPLLAPVAVTAARRLLAERVQTGHRVLFVHTDTRPEKMWPGERWAAVLAALLAADPQLSAVVSGAVPLEHPRLHALDLHFELALAVLGQCHGFLGVDSCFLHAADLFRLPAVGLFGPTEPRHWGLRFTPHAQHVTAPGTMAELEASAVLEACTRLVAP